MTRKFRTGYANIVAPELTLNPVGVFDGGTIILTKIGPLVFARGGVSRSSGSSTTYTTCVDSIPVGWRPDASLGLTAGTVFNTAVGYQYGVFTNGDLMLRMTGATTAGAPINGFWRIA